MVSLLSGMIMWADGLQKKESFGFVKAKPPTPTSRQAHMPIFINYSQSHGSTTRSSKLVERSNGSSSSSSTQSTTGQARRSAKYHSTIWDASAILGATDSAPAHVQAPNDDHHDRLKQAIQGLLQDDQTRGPSERLQLIDAVQRLGVAYHFEDQISDALNGLYSHAIDQASLHTTALYFRLLRHHGFKVSSDIFNKFKEEGGGFKESLCEDALGLLSLHEAAHLGVEGEAVLDEAKAFSTSKLRMMERVEMNLARRIEHALELPLHWRSPRLEARHYIDVYEEEDGKIDDLIDFAKLDFNMLQRVYQTELKELSSWWDFLGLGEKMSFIRDRLLESYFVAAEAIIEPQYSECRKAMAQGIAFITAIDDFYDVHGSIDEIKAFNDAVNRWDLDEGIDQVPDYMKLCYLALYNTTNEMAYIVLRDKGFLVTDYFKKLWATYCNSGLLEAQWFNSGYIPKLEEYLLNGRVSIGITLLQCLSYTMINQHITKEELDSIDKDLNLISWPALIFRISDDLGTSKAEIERGDVAKAIQCYMHETGNSEEVARDHLRCLISDTWKGLNEECLKATTLPKHFVNASRNWARIGIVLYLHDRDGFGVSGQETKARITALFLEPVPLKESTNF